MKITGKPSETPDAERGENSQLKLRVPAALRAQLEAAATENKRRSLNAEVVERLKQSFALSELPAQYERLKRFAMEDAEELARLRKEAKEQTTDMRRFEDAVSRLEETIAEGRRRFEEVERPTLRDSVVALAIVRMIGQGAPVDDELRTLLLEFMTGYGALEVHTQAHALVRPGNEDETNLLAREQIAALRRLVAERQGGKDEGQENVSS